MLACRQLSKRYRTERGVVSAVAGIDPKDMRPQTV